MRNKLFSLSKKDFLIQTFRSGGKGGQHQNKTDSGVRIKHIETGLTGESRTHSSQFQNKKEAFKRLVNSKKFQLWVNRRASEIISGQTIEEEVSKMMERTEDFKIETKDKKGRWQYEDTDDE